MKKYFHLLYFLLILAEPMYAQSVQPAPPLNLLSQGYGAAALGMGGAFVAVANDLSAIYWNPAGLAQLPGLQLWADYRHFGDSDEDIGRASTSVGICCETIVNSTQRYSLSGNQFDSFSGSYAFRKPGFTIVPAFAFQRLSSFAPKRQLKETAETTSGSNNSLIATADFQQKFKKGEDEYAVGVGASITHRIFIGGSWSFLKNGPDETLTGNFVDFSKAATQVVRTNLDLKQTTTTDYSGNYLKLGILAMPAPTFSVGGYVRFPYTRTGNVITNQTGPFTRTITTLDDQGNVIGVETSSGTLDQTQTLKTKLDVPMELSAGAAIRPRVNLLVSGSVTRADWSKTNESFSGSLLQWRGGMEYLMGEVGNGLLIRSGIFRDGQPLGTTGERVYFKGYTLGAGYVSRGIRFDVAYVHEKGDVTLIPGADPSHLSTRRWVFSVGFTGQ